MNKPLDRLAKELADEAVLLLAHLLGYDAAAVAIEAIRPETSPPVTMPDYVAVMVAGEVDRFILHVEFCLAYQARVLESLARYGASLLLQHELEVKTMLVLMDPRRAPRESPATAEFAIGPTSIRHQFRTVRLWELDPAPVFAYPDTRFWPWILLLNSSDEQVRRVAATVRAAGDEETVARFLTLGSVRYHRDELESMMGGLQMSLLQAVLEGPLVQDLVQEAVAKAAAEGAAKGEALGEARGEARGRIALARELLRKALEQKFPGLETLAEIDSIQDVTVLERLLLHEVFPSNDRGAVEHAIRNA